MMLMSSNVPHIAFKDVQVKEIYNDAIAIRNDIIPLDYYFFQI